MMRLLLWIIAKIPLGKLAPYVLGLALGCRPQKIDEDEYDRIISKTPEELADFLNNVNHRLWKHETWLKWLKQETDKKETEV